MTPTLDRSLMPISFGVVAIHICALVASFLVPSTPIQKMVQPPKLLVKTVSLKAPPREEPEIAEEIPLEIPPPPLPPEPEPEPPKPEPEPPKPTPKPEPVEPPKTAPQPKPAPKKQPKKPDSATTKPTPPKPKVYPKPTPKPAPVVAKKPAPAKKVEQPVAEKKVEKKPSDPKPTPVAEQKPPTTPKPSLEEIAAQKKQQALIAQAKENIAKIGKSRDKGATLAAAGLPEGAAIAHLESLHIDALPIDSGVTFTHQESSYRDELASHLKLLLNLPEYGEVKIKLTLERSGKVKKLEVVKAENSANRIHVEKTLPKLKLPPFGSCFGNEENYTFIISLRNE